VSGFIARLFGKREEQPKQRRSVRPLQLEPRIFVSPALAPPLVSGDFHTLTGRECEMLRLVAEGYSNKEIAKLLRISSSTVKNHLTSILRKLDVPDRTSAAVLGLRLGIFTLDELTFPFCRRGYETPALAGRD